MMGMGTVMLGMPLRVNTSVVQRGRAPTLRMTSSGLATGSGKAVS